METQEIRIQAQITLEVSAKFSREELLKKFEGAAVSIIVLENESYKPYLSALNIIEIEEEAQIYGTEGED